MKMLDFFTKCKNKKGFTLVEIIVVLVIIAILAAAGIPSLLGFISSARGSGLLADARAGQQAAQAVGTKYMATDRDGYVPTHTSDLGNFTGWSSTYPAASHTDAFQEFYDLLQPDINGAHFRYRFDSNGMLQELVYSKNSSSYVHMTRTGDTMSADVITASPSSAAWPTLSASAN